jgi:hypothetical protein
VEGTPVVVEVYGEPTDDNEPSTLLIVNADTVPSWALDT